MASRNVAGKASRQKGSEFGVTMYPPAVAAVEGAVGCEAVDSVVDPDTVDADAVCDQNTCDRTLLNELP